MTEGRKHHQFTLVLNGVDEKTNHLEDELFKAGCDDALINFRNGAVYLDFDREGDSLEDAVLSAIKSVEKSNLPAKVVNVAPENLVSESEIAKRLHVRRQSVSLWVKGERRSNYPFPSPIMKLSEKSPLWQWHEVVEWLAEQNKITDRNMIEQAKFMASINMALFERNKEYRSYSHQLMRKLA